MPRKHLLTVEYHNEMESLRRAEVFAKQVKHDPRAVKVQITVDGAVTQAWERSGKGSQWVKVSGGGKCNTTKVAA